MTIGEWLLPQASHVNYLSDVDKLNLCLLWKLFDTDTRVVKQFEKTKIKGQYPCIVLGSIAYITAKCILLYFCCTNFYLYKLCLTK